MVLNGYTFTCDEKVENHKARLVAKEYYQIDGIYFGDICFPIFKCSRSFRFMLSITIYFDLEIY